MSNGTVRLSLTLFVAATFLAACPEIVVSPINFDTGVDADTSADGGGDSVTDPDARPDGTPPPDGVADTVCEPTLERCDGVDNDCDGDIDEGFNLGGIPIGDECGRGVCAGGTVTCDANGTAICTTAVNALETETCANDLDDNCDGNVDEGCLPTDLDGDGFEGPSDCNPYDSAVHPGANESCCPKGVLSVLCDANCDGSITACDDNDGDGDGFPTPSDCDDSNPMAFPGAAEQCGNGIDEDCSGGDLDCAGVNDIDGDGYGNAFDCEPDNPNVNPSVAETCDGKDNDCDGLVDEGNPGGGGQCGAPAGDCDAGIRVCVLGSLECVPQISGSDEVCDGIDNDCDGATDEDFSAGGVPVGAACDGVGACGAGVVECNAAQDGALCSTEPGGSADQSSEEICDPFDNDCDGELNEELSPEKLATLCTKAGVCSGADATIAGSCTPDGTLICDYTGISTYEDGVELSCDGLDNNCDGFVDETWGIGTGCDGPDADSCANGIMVCSPAGGAGGFCDESGGSAAKEICDGLDNDCDSLVDEDFVDLGLSCDGPDSDQCANGSWNCAPDGSGLVCNNETILDLSEVCGNENDDDCDGTVDEDDCVPGA